MKSELFKLNGIGSPGRIEIFGHGTICLEDATDDVLKALHEKGCKFIVPTEKGLKELYPDRKVIEISETPFVVKPTPKEPSKKTSKRR
jgi:hypothetical protein